LGHFNGTVSSMKHLKDMPGADSVKKKGNDGNEINTEFNKLRGEIKIVYRLTSAYGVSTGYFPPKR